MISEPLLILCISFMFFYVSFFFFVLVLFSLLFLNYFTFLSSSTPAKSGNGLQSLAVPFNTTSASHLLASNEFGLVSPNSRTKDGFSIWKNIWLASVHATTTPFLRSLIFPRSKGTAIIPPTYLSTPLFQMWNERLSTPKIVLKKIL